MNKTAPNPIGTYFMIKNLLITSFFIFLFMPAHKIYAQNADQTDINVGKAPIVVELYTSQGCSSCPPADKILGQLAQHPRIFALSCHVTYWDYLGWKDTLAHPFCTDRQTGYRKVKNARNYYTPQMIINGNDEFPGHRSGKIKAAIERANNNPIKPISLSHKNKQTIVAGLPTLGARSNYTLWVFGYKKHHNENVQQGENRNRKLQSTNSIHMLESLGKWDGRQGMKRFDIGKTDDIDGLVVVAQINGYGPIAAAGRIEF